MAADPTSNTMAPYSQAAASVNADGSTSQETNTIASVSNGSTGLYCVVLASGVEAARGARGSHLPRVAT
ncbi:hypothetical protein [Streptomyces sp. NPDC054901]